MRILKVFNEEDISQEDIVEFKHRRSVRGVVFDNEGYVALLHSRAKGYFEIPGGGIEGTESPEAAVVREMKEELGCDITEVQEIGITKEIRGEHELLNEAFGFIAHVDGEKGIPDFQEDEAEEDFVVLWLRPEEALRKLSAMSPEKLYHRYIKKRAITFIEKAISINSLDV
jgi:8-oxo-dGTP diphosphatase